MIRYFIAFLLYIIYIILVIFKNIKIYLDLEFYKLHKLKLIEVFSYKTFEILLLYQYKRRHKNVANNQIIKEVTVDILHIYNKYFKKSVNK